MNKHTSETTRRRQRDPVKEQQWRQRLKLFASSGKSVREFCAIHQLTETAFYFWRSSDVQRRDAQIPPPRQHAKPRSTRSLAFTRVFMEPRLTDDGLRLRLNGGRELLLPASMPPEHVARLIRALEAIS